MEELNNINVEDTAMEIVEGVTDKLSFGETCLSYTLAGVFITGAVTIGYVVGYKGVRKVLKTIKNKKKSVTSNDEVVDVESNCIHEVIDDETEQD